MFRLLAAILLVVALLGCAPSVPVTTTTTTKPAVGADTPDGALRTLLSAVGEDDLVGVATVTDDAQVALLIALDGAELSEVASMLRDGVPESSLTAFWASFQNTYARSLGEDVEGMLIGEGEHATVDGVEFAIVKSALRKSSGATEWIARRESDGSWRVDLFATFGPIFAQPMRLWLTTLPDDLETGVVRKALAAQRPSLLAAIQRHPLGPISPGVAEQMRGLLVDVGATG